MFFAVKACAQRAGDASPCPVCHAVAAGRKKRRGRSGEEVDDGSNAAVPLEQNHAQIIQHMPNGGGDYALLHHLTGMMPPGDIPPDVAAAFDGLHLTQQQVGHSSRVYRRRHQQAYAMCDTLCAHEHHCRLSSCRCPAVAATESRVPPKAEYNT